jgi:hypothetical protein
MEIIAASLPRNNGAQLDYVSVLTIIILTAHIRLVDAGPLPVFHG